MYFPYFIAYMVIGLVISVIVFSWALKNGQFKDQQRARFLPLEREPEALPADVSRFHRIEPYLVLGIVCSGLLASAVFVLFVLVKSGTIPV